jgi:hypothetical protein
MYQPSACSAREKTGDCLPPRRRGDKAIRNIVRQCRRSMASIGGRMGRRVATIAWTAAASGDGTIPKHTPSSVRRSLTLENIAPAGVSAPSARRPVGRKSES